MRSGVIAQKLGMTRVFTGAGEHVPVTVLKLGGCQVVAHRTKDRNGYTAVQLGIGHAKVKNVSKAERGRFAVAKVEPKLKLAEFRVEEDALLPVGAEITAVQRVIEFQRQNSVCEFASMSSTDENCTRCRGWRGLKVRHLPAADHAPSHSKATAAKPSETFMCPTG